MLKIGDKLQIIFFNKINNNKIADVESYSIQRDPLYYD
jgi:hypothetical protein